MTAQPFFPPPLIVIDIDFRCIHSDKFCIIIDMKMLPVIHLFFHIKNSCVNEQFPLHYYKLCLKKYFEYTTFKW